jgi:dethiobiotin synthetase
LRKIIFVTGTDTGVGKTLLTCLLLCHLRRRGVNALAMKPFCSGRRNDVELIQTVQDHALPDGEVNPFYFPESLAPLVAARKHRRRISLSQVLRSIARVETQCERVIIEGSGGVLVPLGEGFSVADLIAKLHCEIVVVARNRVGTINHTLLAVRSLQHATNQSIKIILMGQKRRDLSAFSNGRILGELLAPTPVLTLRFLGENATRPEAFEKNQEKIKKVLALLCNQDSLCPVRLNAGGKRRKKAAIQPEKNVLTARSAGR